MTTHEDEFDGRPDLVKARARAIVVQRVAASLVGLSIVASLTLLTFNALQSTRTRETLLDCTVPSGKCYAQGQKRTGEAIQQLIDANSLNEVATRRIVVLTAVCDDLPGVDTVDELQACVDRKLARDVKKKREGTT